jgi:osmoprotectant transport system substrate-binding protein
MNLRRSPARLLCALLLSGVAGVGAAVLGGCGADSATSATASTAPATAGKLPGTGRPLVTIGDKNFTEQFVLGELYAQALEAQGYSVVLNRNIGPVEVTTQALYSGRLSMYPEYVGVWDAQVAGLHREFSNGRAALAAARAYARAHGVELLDATPFSDTGAVAVTAAYAQANHLRTIGDLSRVSGPLQFGAAPELGQPDGELPRLEQRYRFTPTAFKPLAIGTQYQALRSGGVQAAIVSSTDGEPPGPGFRLLADPLRVFGWGRVVPVVPHRVLALEGPAFARTINRVSALLHTATIRRLNAAVDLQGQDPAVVAKQFLQANGLLGAGSP